jgi:hypothetical protein
MDVALLDQVVLTIAFRYSIGLIEAMRAWEALADSGFGRVEDESDMLCMSAALIAVRTSASLSEEMRIAGERQLWNAILKNIDPKQRDEVARVLGERVAMYRHALEWPEEKRFRRVGNAYVEVCDIFNSSAGQDGAKTFMSVTEMVERSLARQQPVEHSASTKSAPSVPGTDGERAQRAPRPPKSAPGASSAADGAHRAGDDAAMRRVNRLGQLNSQLLGLRNEFGPLYEYYFPARWSAMLSGWLRRREPNYGAHVAILTNQKERAWKMNVEAKGVWEEIAGSALPGPQKGIAEALYHQIYYDTVTIMVFAVYVTAMRDGDSSASEKSFGAVREASAAAQRNLKKLAKRQALLARSGR